jgi:hypothetical protein
MKSEAADLWLVGARAMPRAAGWVGAAVLIAKACFIP